MLALLPLVTLLLTAPPPPSEAERAFEALTGAELVWARDDLPDGVLFDRTPELPAAKRDRAAAILLDEAQKYPPSYFARIGLTRIGVFAACVSDTGDGFRAYDESLGGFRYFGQWAPEDGRGALIAAFYSEGQLPQTFHHEVFHHIDATLAGEVDYRFFKSDDARFAEAVEGERPYKAPRLDAQIVKALSDVAGGDRLDGANGAYSKKSAGEDQAEVARWFMTNLPEALVQITRTPTLGGSQRILHLLSQYAGATRTGTAADVDWFVARALGRPLASDTAVQEADPNETRAWLEAQAEAARRGASTASADRIAQATIALTRARLEPQDGDTRFKVWTPARFQGGSNPVLRADVLQIGADAARLGAWMSAPTAAQAKLRAAQDELLTLLTRYRAFIAANWDISTTTAQAFDEAERAIRSTRLVGARPAGGPGERDEPARPIARPVATRADNPHIDKVDVAISDATWASRVRAAQPATVKIGGGSGVNLHASGIILTNAHVAENVGDILQVTFPDGARYRGTTIASDHHADLALVALQGAPDDLPIAPVARKAPGVGADVAAIGQPGRLTPSGEPTGYDGWHVSVGKVRGFLDDLYGDQSLGRAKHSAWTYWGHSGSPLFDRNGAVALLHNSWDSKTAMRHGVPHQVIVRFLEAHDVDYTTR